MNFSSVSALYLICQNVYLSKSESFPFLRIHPKTVLFLDIAVHVRGPKDEDRENIGTVREECALFRESCPGSGSLFVKESN